MELVYKVDQRPSFGKTLVFALQQLLAILAATIAVPAIINSPEMANLIGTEFELSQSAALFGAGIGTLVYLLFTKFKSPVFLGSSFAFLGSMNAAFSGAISAAAGYAGLLIGAASAGLIYVIIAIIVKFAGVKWIGKLMPPVVIGPTVAIIGLSLASNAVKDLTSGDGIMKYVSIICGLVTLFVTMICSVYGKKFLKMIPFIIGICAGYLTAVIFTLCGIKVVDFSAFQNMTWIPNFTFLTAFKDGFALINFKYVLSIIIAYAPVAFVVFAEHIADHKNLSSIIEADLLEDPGLHRTLLGDGVGSIAGAFFGGCPNTTYGESVGCVAISGNASITTIFTTACLAIVSSFIAPFTTALATIPSCVMGGVCFALYGFIAVSGLKMIKDVDLGDNRNLFVVSVILIAGVGGLELNFGEGDHTITITEVACALILGIITNLILAKRSKKDLK